MKWFKIEVQITHDNEGNDIISVLSSNALDKEDAITNFYTSMGSLRTSVDQGILDAASCFVINSVGGAEPYHNYYPGKNNVDPSVMPNSYYPVGNMKWLKLEFQITHNNDDEIVNLLISDALKYEEAITNYLTSDASLRTAVDQGTLDEETCMIVSLTGEPDVYCDNYGGAKEIEKLIEEGIIDPEVTK